MGFPGVLLAVSLAFLCAAEVPPLAPDWVPRLIPPEEAAEGFYPLYNGSDLDGWTVAGANKHVFSAQGDVLAITGGAGGEWLVTTERYEQFVLRYGYRVFEAQASAPTEQTGSGSKKGDTPHKTPAEKHGRGASQQGVAIGIGDDGANGVQMLHAAAYLNGPLGEWNEAEVVSEGGRVRMTVNGVEVGNAPARPGYIGIRDCGQRVEFRGIRIKPLPGLSGWRQWDGKGGDVFPESFELQFRFKPTVDARGGVAFGALRKPVFEVRIDNHDAESFTGSLAGKAEALELRAMDGCWNHMRIAMERQDIRVWVNGKTVVDFIMTRRVSSAGGDIRFNVDRGLIDFEDIQIKAKE
ncbi:MAG: DUF1080 domain-containing protein [Candidatus Hydrogenedentes bacterium]|nr:DUF1080 domain-containing protein [Candidatus Hydrogenedentota bacterium]